MCLNIKPFSRLKTASNDIICYKHLMVRDDKFITPYIFQVINIGETYTSILKREKNICNPYLLRLFKTSVNRGLHSFAYKVDAKIDIDSEKEIIVKCVIPIGAKYYEGTFADCVSYASTTLKYIEICG